MTLLGKSIFADVNQEGSLYDSILDYGGGRGVLHPMTSVLMRDRTENKLRGGEDHVKTQPDIGTMQPQAKERPEHQKLEEARPRVSVRAFGGKRDSGDTFTLDF